MTADRLLEIINQFHAKAIDSKEKAQSELLKQASWPDDAVNAAAALKAANARLNVLENLLYTIEEERLSQAITF